MYYDLDDVLLVPKLTTLISREEVAPSNFPQNVGISPIPIMIAPMKGIVNLETIKIASRHKAIGIMHRFLSLAELATFLAGIEEVKGIRYGIAIGLGEESQLQKILSCKESPKVICVDVANGYLLNVRDYCRRIAPELHDRGILLMAGNVSTKEGVSALREAGVDLVRVGIGTGALCTTRFVTGVGVPQWSAIKDCANVGVSIVADGGIKNSGDAVKAFAAGAEYVMMGSYFGTAFEADHNGFIYGMASKTLQEEYYGSFKSVEGIEKLVSKMSSSDELWSNLIWGIRSAMTYLDAFCLDDLRRAEVIYLK